MNAVLASRRPDNVLCLGKSCPAILMRDFQCPHDDHLTHGSLDEPGWLYTKRLHSVYEKKGLINPKNDLSS